mgnify:CR=1 FL=1
MGRCVLALFLAGYLSGCAQEAPIEGASCNAEHPCPSPYSCLGGACGRLGGGVILGCGEDGDCASEACLEEAGFCVQCDSDEDCLGQSCLGGLFVCGCLQGSDCATGRCLTETATCVSCYSDVQCESGSCDVGSGRCAIVQRTGEPSVREGGEER